MFNELIDQWWLVAGRGAIAVLFGIAALLAPEKTFDLLISLFAAFVLADASFAMIAGLSLNWFSLFLEGVAGASVGLLALFYPPAAHVGLVPLIVAWALVTGALELQATFWLRRVTGDAMTQTEWLLAASGVLSIIFGLLIATQWTSGPVWFITLLGWYALMSGILLLVLGLSIRTWRRTVA